MKTWTMLLSGLAFGCSVEPCDSTQRLDKTGFCVEQTTGGTAGGPADATDTAGVSGEGGSTQGGEASCEQPSSFGDACARSQDCRCEVDYCALQPGATEGVCTRTGCVEDPSICPASWQCLDLSAFDASLPAICVPPA